MTQSPISVISPLASAHSMKKDAGTSPRVGRSQRNRASRPATNGPSSSRDTIGWNMRQNSSRSSARRRSCSSANRSAMRSRIELSNMVTMSRPAPLAWYMAVSASRSMVSASVVGSDAELRVTPTLALTNRSAP